LNYLNYHLQFSQYTCWHQVDENTFEGFWSQIGTKMSFSSFQLWTAVWLHNSYSEKVHTVCMVSVPGTNKQDRFGSWEPQRGRGLYLCQLRKQYVLWLGAVLVYTHVRHVCLLVMCQLVPTLYRLFYYCCCLLCHGKYVRSACVHVHSVSVRAARGFSQDGKCPICVSTNNEQQSTTHPLPGAQLTHLYSKHSRPLIFLSLLFPPTFFLFSFFLVLPTSRSFPFLCSAQQSAENQRRTFLTLHDCAHMWMYTQGDGHETNVWIIKPSGRMTLSYDLVGWMQPGSVEKKSWDACLKLDRYFTLLKPTVHIYPLLNTADNVYKQLFNVGVQHNCKSYLSF